MIRTQIYITEQEKKGLESMAAIRKVSQSNLIRQAIDNLLVKSGGENRISVIDEVAGIWSDRDDLTNVRDLRVGWQRRQLG
ncbi:MAG: ribbon-helix-helix protein, CopG family [Desulfuromusa sp.]|nr:ribbon-helix-helix protein, CopG family [Desulfuromusa sp.]